MFEPDYDVAVSTSVLAAQLAVEKRETARLGLLENPQLHPEAALLLIGSGLTPSQAGSLAAHPVSDDQEVLAALLKDKRADPTAQVLAKHGGDREVVEQILARGKYPAAVTNELVRRFGQLDAEQRYAVASTGAHSAVFAHALIDSLDVASIAALLRTGKPSKASRRLVPFIVQDYPDAIDALEDFEAYAPAIAASTRLGLDADRAGKLAQKWLCDVDTFKYALMALLGNPVLAPELTNEVYKSLEKKAYHLFHEVWWYRLRSTQGFSFQGVAQADERTAKSLARRAIRPADQSTRLRLWYLPELLLNENLDTVEISTLATLLDAHLGYNPELELAPNARALSGCVDSFAQMGFASLAESVQVFVEQAGSTWVEPERFPASFHGIGVCPGCEVDRVPMRRYSRSWVYHLHILEDVLGEDQAKWSVALQMIPDYDGDLVEFAHLVSDMLS